MLLVLGDSGCRRVNLVSGHGLLFREPARQKGNVLANESIQDAVVDFADFGTKFIDTVTQQVGSGTS